LINATTGTGVVVIGLRTSTLAYQYGPGLYSGTVYDVVSGVHESNHAVSNLSYKPDKNPAYRNPQIRIRLYKNPDIGKSRILFNRVFPMIVLYCDLYCTVQISTVCYKVHYSTIVQLGKDPQNVCNLFCI
jgi:hypothetical protein